MPQHYNVVVKPFNDVSMYLDTDYGLGWRAVMIAAHPNGRELIILLERKADK